MSFETTVSVPTPSRRLNRRLAVVGSVLGFHVLAVWALQSGLLRRAVELVIPVEVMAELIEPPQPQVTPEPPAPAPPAPKPPPPKPRPAPPPRPLPVATPSPAPAPIQAAPPEPVVPAPPAPVMPAPPPAPPAPPAPAPVVTLPSSQADYLSNPKPAYPSLSKRMGEQGRVLVRAFVDTKGMPSRVEVARSSGFERLDKTAVDTVLRWRFVPGKRGGEPVAMWVEVPIVFELNFSN
ncbi:MAG: energy transducer TonB [Hydrogenophaga sp. SCN 70-13]|jgi:protein TonB|uniref:energy transducer TonB n=1 Tax=Hydrogenophaga borbori TaxID=2294117 RepID=UPI00086A02F0|nr:MAG: energy transducer TonB [Hydrogenophaga sp. SCN 70-13]